ncbi:Predicted protein [Anoxybacillus flavithermus WK1]|uniref:Uncharacterized protein n=1 Tax=Anoxybacillus flavithermus (strain DSM 21510 / WK1) TaxID=491915 RepID=B7GHK7_ANOFW|nr:Predicted protein [Anoxybacillus flavithermus WK1]
MNCKMSCFIVLTVRIFAYNIYGYREREGINDGRYDETSARCCWNGCMHSFTVSCWIKQLEKENVVLYNVKQYERGGENDVNRLP